MSEGLPPEDAPTVGRLWQDADGEGWSALSNDMIGFVRGWSIFGIVLFVGGMIALSIAGLADHVWSAAGVLWLNIPVLACCLWIWRRQFVPFRTGPAPPVIGPAARRFALKLLLLALVGDALALATTGLRIHAPLRQRMDLGSP